MAKQKAKNKKSYTPYTPNEADFITLTQAARATGRYSNEYLKLRINQGKLQGKKIGRNWHTTRKWVEEYIAEYNKGKEQASTPSDKSTAILPVEGVTGLTGYTQEKLRTLIDSGELRGKKLSSGGYYTRLDWLNEYIAKVEGNGAPSVIASENVRHPELVSGPVPESEKQMLKQVQHDGRFGRFGSDGIAAPAAHRGGISNNQFPITKEAPTTNFQEKESLEFGTWKVSGIWKLGFGNLRFSRIALALGSLVLAITIAIPQTRAGYADMALRIADVARESVAFVTAAPSRVARAIVIASENIRHPEPRHPELVSGSVPESEKQMLKQVQHDGRFGSDGIASPSTARNDRGFVLGESTERGSFSLFNSILSFLNPSSPDFLVARLAGSVVELGASQTELSLWDITSRTVSRFATALDFSRILQPAGEYLVQVEEGEPSGADSDGIASPASSADRDDTDDTPAVVSGQIPLQPASYVLPSTLNLTGVNTGTLSADEAGFTTVTVAGATILNGPVSVASRIHAIGGLISDAALSTQSLSVASDATFNGPTTFNAPLSVNDNITIRKDLNVVGTSVLSGSVTVGGNLAVQGTLSASSFAPSSISTGSINASSISGSSLTVSGPISGQSVSAQFGSFDQLSAANISIGTDSGDTVDFIGAVTVQNGLTANTLTVSGATTLTGALTASSATLSGSAIIAGNLDVSGTLTAEEAVSTISTSTSALHVTGTTATSTLSTGGFTIGTNQFLVQQTSGRVGIATTSPSALFSVGGNALFGGTLSLEGAATLHTTATVAGAATLQSTLSVLGNTTLSGTLSANSTLAVATTTTTQFTTGYDSTNYLAFQTDASGTTTLNAIGGQYASLIAVDPLRIATSSGNAFEVTDGTNTTITVNTTSNRLGVGTTTPSELLAVGGNSLLGGTLRVEQAGSFDSTLAVTDTATFTANIAVNSTTATSTFATAGFAIGTNRLVVQGSTGRVGIGTANPQSPLEVTGDIRISSGSGGAIVFADGTSINTSSVPGSAGSVSNTSDAIITGDSDSDAAGSVLLKTGSNTRLAVLNSGNIGVATTTPGQLLDVYGNLRVGVSGSASHLIFADTSAIRVGIGTSTPGALFSVAGAGLFSGNLTTESAFTVAGASTLQSTASITGSATFLSNIDIQTTTATSTFATGGLAVGTSQFVVQQTSGRIGIGTINPQEVLHVVGNQILTGTLLANGNITTGGTLSASGAVFNLGTGSATSTLTATATGLGVGSSTPYGFFSINPDGGEPSFVVGSSTTQLIITDAGRVGIGTTTPGSLLSVGGSTYLGGVLSVRDAATLNSTLAITGATTLSSTLAVTDTATFTANIAVNSTTATSTIATGGLAVGTNQFVVQQTSGRIGIGTINPQEVLHVVGNQFITGTLLAAGTADFGGALSASGAVFNLGTGSATSTLTATATGLGVGSSTPYGFFSINPDGGEPSFVVGSSTTQLIVTDAGNVGIGTTTPSHALSVNGAALFSGNLTSEGVLTVSGGGTVAGATTLSSTLAVTDTATFTANIAVNSTTATSTFSTAGFTVGTSRLVVQESSGNVGIGTTTPAYLTDINGAFRVGLQGATTDYLLFANTTTDKVGVATSTPWAKLSVANTQTTYPSFAVADSSGNTDFVVLANGNVGIGTTGPGEPLHIKTNETGAGTSLFRLDNSGTLSNEIGMEFFTSSSDATSAFRTGRIYGKWDGDSYVSARLTLQSMTTGNTLVNTLSLKNGNVGIGTTAPGSILHISGATPVLRIDASNNNVDNTIQLLGRNSNGGQESKVQFVHGVTETGSGIGATLNVLTTKESAGGSTFTSSMFIDKLGNVGIGTTAPGYKLHIKVDGGGSGSGIKIEGGSNYDGLLVTNQYDSENKAFIGQFDDGVAAGSGALRLWDDTGASVESIRLFGEAGRPSFINNGGNVGIGTTTPASLLSVQGNGYFSGTGFFGGAITGTSTLSIQSTTATSTFSTGGLTVGTSQFVVQQTSGNVGIGTAGPLGLLHVNTAAGFAAYDAGDPATWATLKLTQAASTAGEASGGIRFQTLTDANAAPGIVGIIGAGGSGEGHLAFITASGNADFERMRITDTGNVGIGTTTPGQKLHVEGGALKVVSSNVGGTPGLEIHDSEVTSFGASNALTAYNAGTGFGSNDGAGLSFFSRVTSGNIITAVTNSGEAPYTFRGVQLDTSHTGSLFDFLGYQYDGVGTASTDFEQPATLMRVGYNSAGSSEFPFVIMGSGNVGIGTTGPISKLEVSGSSAFGLTLRTATEAVNEYQGVTFLAGGTTDEATNRIAAIQAVITQATPSALKGKLIFNVNTGDSRLDAMVIDGDGNVGIGTTSPSYKLHVYNNANGFISRFTGGTSSDVNIGIFGSTASAFGSIGTESNHPFRLFTNGVDRVSILTNGNVGIGTTAPAAKLDVEQITGDTGSALYAWRNLAAANTDSPLVNFHNDNVGDDQVALKISQDGTGDILNLFDGATEVFTVIDGGNVGIGTTGPGFKLHITDNAGAVEVLSTAVTDTGGSALGFRKSRGTHASPTVVSAGDTIATIDFNAYNDAFRLAAQIKGLVATGVGATGADMPGHLTFLTTPDGSATLAERMRIQSDGNVGIGTTNPGAKLDILKADTVSFEGLRLQSDNAVRAIGDNVYQSVYISDSGGVQKEAARITTIANDVTWNMALSSIGFDVRTKGAAAENTALTRGMTIMGTTNNQVNVGIGTTSPLEKLNVYGGQVQLSRAVADTGYGQLGFDDAGSYKWQVGLRDGNHDFHLYNNIVGADSLTVLSTNGNVGIGTTGPGNKLHVVGASETTFPNNPSVIEIQSSDAQAADMGAGIRFGGKYTDAGLLTTFGYIGGLKETGTTAETGGKLVFGTRTNGQGAVDMTRMTITSTGNVGIGTTAPAAKLDVEQITGDTGSALYAWRNLAAANTDSPLVNFHNDNVGDDQVALKISQDGTGDILNLFDGATEVFTVIDGGNVGIGTTTPATLLEVGGTTANVTFDGYKNCTGFTSNGNGLLACTASDLRLKQDIATLGVESGLAGIADLRPISFLWNPGANRGAGQQYGLIAQEVQGVFPNLVITSSPTALTPDGTLSINYEGLISPMVLAIQELDQRTKGIETTGQGNLIITGDLLAQNNAFFSGMLGIGATIPSVPLAPLHVAGRCMTGDTLLAVRRRRRRKIGATGDEEEGTEGHASTEGNVGSGMYEYLFVRIDEILPGDEVMSLNEETNRAEYRRVKARMDMGVKKIYEIRTKSGRVIRTTANHPYLARLQNSGVKNLSEKGVQDDKIDAKSGDENITFTSKTSKIFKTREESGAENRDMSASAKAAAHQKATPDGMAYGTVGQSGKPFLPDEIKGSIAHQDNLSSGTTDNQKQPWWSGRDSNPQFSSGKASGLPVNPTAPPPRTADTAYHESAARETVLETHCPYCAGDNYVKRGTRKKKLETVQLYWCNDCERTFTPGSVKGKRYPMEVILDAMSLYHLGFSLSKAARLANAIYHKNVEEELKAQRDMPQSEGNAGSGTAKHPSFNLSPGTLFTWLQQYSSLCAYSRMREFGSKLYPPEKIIESATLAHRQLYRFRHHKAKSMLIIDEDFKNHKFAPLREFLDLVPAECPHQYFQEGLRASEAPIGFSKSDMIVRAKKNYATMLASFVLQSVSRNKDRHDALQRFLLANDSVTVATEVPVYIRREDLAHMQTQLGFVLFKKAARRVVKSVKDLAVMAIDEAPKLITGHIDFVQIRNGFCHIMDYKPNAAKERPLEQLTLYALALSRLTGLRVYDFKCAWFDENDYFEFFPLHMVYKNKKRKQKRVITIEGEYRMNKDPGVMEQIRPQPPP